MFLNYIDRVFPNKDNSNRSLWRTCWSVGLFDFCIKLSIIYTIIFIIINWSYYGQDVFLGEIWLIGNVKDHSIIYLCIFTLITILLNSVLLQRINPREYLISMWMLGAIYGGMGVFGGYLLYYYIIVVSLVSSGIVTFLYASYIILAMCIPGFRSEVQHRDGFWYPSVAKQKTVLRCQITHILRALKETGLPNCALKVLVPQRLAGT